jgi:renalase
MVRLDQSMLPNQYVFSDMPDVIRWIARNNAKPGRTLKDEAIVAHSSPQWSRETGDAEPEFAAEELWSEVCHVLALPPVWPSQMTAHLWRYGLVEQPLGETYIYSSQSDVGVAGDWCLARLSEHAFESGAVLGRAVVASLD